MRAAVVDLREVAHGLFPTVLADEGLAPAIDVLAEQAPRLVARRLPDGRFPDAGRVRRLLRRARGAAR